MIAQPTTRDSVQRLSLDEALAQAKFLQRTEKLDEADTIYSEILEQIPQEPNALHFLGILRHQQGDAQNAIRLIRQAAELMPDEPGPWVNLGNVLLEGACVDDAVDAYEHAAAMAPDLVLPLNNLGILHGRRRRWDQAEDCFKRGLRLAPDCSYLHHNYARMLHAAGRLREAAAHGLQSLELDPTSGTARKLLSMSYFLLGETAKAVSNLEQWRALEPDNPEIAHHLAACGSGEIPGRASDAYVERVFDEFASSFDQQLQSLGYRAPQLVHAALERMTSAIGPAPFILDVGCGTGLCGALLRPHARSLHGVDLSAGMMVRARERGIYDALHRQELTAYLHSTSEAYDVIVSADTLCYFGALEDFLAGARQALRRSGVLIFSLEAATDETSRFELQVHGRYAHSSRYVEDALAAAGFTLASLEREVLRHEFIQPVQGLIVVATLAESAATPALDAATRSLDRLTRA